MSTPTAPYQFKSIVSLKSSDTTPHRARRNAQRQPTCTTFIAEESPRVRMPIRNIHGLVPCRPRVRRRRQSVQQIIMGAAFLHAALLTVSSSQLSMASAFSALPVQQWCCSSLGMSMQISGATVTRRPRTTHLKARLKSQPVATVQRVQPRTTSSDLQRQKAVSAMNRNKVQHALAGMDVEMLALLSDQFRYSSTIGSVTENQQKQQEPLLHLGSTSTEHQRPKGRPECVPGAMTQETMIKFRERQAMSNFVEKVAINSEPVSSAELSAIAPFIGREISNANAAPLDKEKAMASDRKSMPKGYKAALSGAAVPEGLPVVGAAANDQAVKKNRKRVVKHLPKPKERSLNDSNGATSGSDVDEGRRIVKRHPNHQANGMDLQKYYRTDLLTPDEEYSLGMKIHFTTKCEHVHEGLASALGRLPSLIEWAAACGFTDDDPLFVATEADEQLRPVGSDEMFSETDPYMFVGNGLAQDTGPGRGRGRTKKAPSTALKDFIDDSEYRVAVANYKKSKNKDLPRPKRSDLQPINRGTPTRFVEMLMTGRDAKQRMVQSNMRLVVSIARKYSNVGVSLQDLVQEGSLGLSRAAEKFEPQKGFKFSTYASWWAQQAVFRSIAYQSRTIRLPVHVHNLLNRLRKVKHALQMELGRAPTNEELARKLGMTVEKYNKMMSLTKRSISLEAPKYKSNPKDLGHEGDDSIGDTISASCVLIDETTPEKRVDHGLFHEDLAEMMKILDDDERYVISARYGLKDGMTRTVNAVAAQMKQSKAWVRSQECRALRKLRRPWYEKKLKEHEDALMS